MTETSHDDLIGGSAAVELSSNRTSLSFERTRMAADRTLMAMLRTSLSLISFGFAIYETFRQLAEKELLAGAALTARRLGFTLLLLGVLLLTMGIVSHLQFRRRLSARRARLHDLALMHRAVEYHATSTFVVAVLLWIAGMVTIASIVIRVMS